MIRATERGIRDYMQPERRPRPTVHDSQGKSRGFGGILQSALQRDAERISSGSSASSVQDYIRRAGSTSAGTKPIRRSSGAHDVERGGGTPQVDTPLPASPAAVSESSSREQQIEHAIQTAARKYALPPRLLRSMIRHESNFDPQAVSAAGAQGLMQLMPDTARELGVDDPFDIHQNIDGGARYLRQMLDRFRGNRSLALAAYNAGPGTIARYGGVPPYPETRRYVQQVLTDAQRRRA